MTRSALSLTASACLFTLAGILAVVLLLVDSQPVGAIATPRFHCLQNTCGTPSCIMHVEQDGNVRYCCYAAGTDVFAGCNWTDNTNDQCQLSGQFKTCDACKRVDCGPNPTSCPTGTTVLNQDVNRCTNF